MIGMIQNKLKKIFQNKKFLINNLHDLGYIFYGPLIYAFFLWIEQNSLKKDKKKILFCAREGFYFKKLFDDFFNKNKGFKTIYFKVSRRLSVVPTFKNKNDILESFKSHRFEGNQKFLFKERFGIDKFKSLKNSRILNSKNKNDFKKIEKLINSNLELILRRSNFERKNYLNYLNKLNLNNSIIVDGGIYGSVQKSIRKLTKLKLDGYYILSRKHSKQHSFFDNNSGFFDFFPLIEIFFNAPHGSYLYFDNNGRCIKAKKTKNQNLFKKKNDLYLGVRNFIKEIKYFKNNLEIKDNKINQNLIETLFLNLSSKDVKISNKILSLLYLDNKYVRQSDKLFKIRKN